MRLVRDILHDMIAEEPEMKTRTEMTPRERDALVAEKVMGWTVIETDDCGGVDNFWLSKDGQHPYHNEFGIDLDLPEYTRLIAAAWKVVEKMEAEGYDYIIAPDEVAFATLETAEAWGEDPTAGNGSIPEAICLAALRAKGIDV